MNSLQEILGAKKFEAPSEMKTISDYILKRYKTKSVIKLQRETVVVGVPNSALAATLRLEQQSLIDACGLTKKLVIRIGY